MMADGLILKTCKKNMSEPNNCTIALDQQNNIKDNNSTQKKLIADC